MGQSPCFFQEISSFPLRRRTADVGYFGRRLGMSADSTVSDRASVEKFVYVMYYLVLCWRLPNFQCCEMRSSAFDLGTFGVSQVVEK